MGRGLALHRPDRPLSAFADPRKPSWHPLQTYAQLRMRTVVIRVVACLGLQLLPHNSRCFLDLTLHVLWLGLATLTNLKSVAFGLRVQAEQRL